MTTGSPAMSTSSSTTNTSPPPMDTTQAFLQAFLDIPVSERDAALKRLVSDHLEAQQVKVVQLAISERHDPLSIFPLEVVIHVFEHLHPFDVWSNRLVSRRWNDVLSSKDFLVAALKRFADHVPTDSALPPTSEAPPSMADVVRHEQALRLGRPFTFKQLDASFDNYEVKVLLKGKYIAYRHGTFQEGSNIIVVHDLISGYTARLQGEAREKISHLALTSEIVAFVTYSGMLYTTPLLDLPNLRKATRLPSSNVHAFAGDQSVTACLIKGPKMITVVINDTARAKSTAFAFSYQSLPQGSQSRFPNSLIVDAEQRTVDVLLLVVDKKEEDYRGRLGVQRFSFDGTMLATHVCSEQDDFQLRYSDLPDEWHGDPNTTDRQIATHSSTPRPAGRRKLYEWKMFHWNNDHVFMLYDAEAMTFSAFPRPEICDKKGLDGMSWGNTSMWKGYVYHVALSVMVHSENPPYVFTVETKLLQPYNMIELANKTPLPPWCGGVISWHLPTGGRNNPSEYVDLYHYDLQINDTFAVIGLNDEGDGSIQVLCFDERIRMHRSQPTRLWEKYKVKEDLWNGEDEIPFVDGDVPCAFDGSHNGPVPRWRRHGWRMPNFMEQEEKQQDQAEQGDFERQGVEQ